jgi:hypothetical protein
VSDAGIRADDDRASERPIEFRRGVELLLDAIAKLRGET